MTQEIDYTKQAALSSFDLGSFGDSLRNTFADGKVPASLLAGGAAGLLAGGMAASGKRKRDESRLGRLARILGSAALVGGGVGAGVHLVGDAVNSAENLLPKADVSTPEKLTGVTDKNVVRSLIGGGTAAELYRRGMNREDSNFRGLLRSNSIGSPDAIRKGLIEQYKPALPGRSSHEVLTMGLMDPANTNSKLVGKNLDVVRPKLNEAGVFPHNPNSLVDSGVDKLVGRLPGARQATTRRYVRGGLSGIRRHGARLVGTSVPGAVGRSALLAAAFASPEIMKALLNSVTAHNDPNIYK
jgi:hypothetical protein